MNNLNFDSVNNAILPVEFPNARPRWPLKLARILSRIEAVWKFASAIASVELQDSARAKAENAVLRSRDLLALDNDEAADFGSGYGYTDELAELETAVKYARQIDRNFPGPSESRQLYSHAESRIDHVLRGGGVEHFLNFGVSFAHIDSLLAKKHPQIKFTGIDRSNLTKAFNQACFSSIQNMRFVSDDIFHFLSQLQISNGVFFHCRTLVLLPPSFIRRLYRAVAKAGFNQIVCMEQVGVSRQTGKPYEFSEKKQDSVAFRDGMYIHNYPEFLIEAGFRPTAMELVKTEHPHPDLRIFSAVARLA